MRRGYYVRHFGPSYVYIRFRCSRCKKLGEHFVRQEEWEEGLLQEQEVETAQHERERFDQLGIITLDEMRDFHHVLENLNTIPDLLLEEKE